MIAARQGGERPRSRATAADGGEASEHGHYRQILGLQVQGPPRFGVQFRCPGHSDAAMLLQSARQHAQQMAVVSGNLTNVLPK